MLAFRRLVVLLVASCLLSAGTTVAPALAGTYSVHTCRFPDGAPAPTAGWRPEARHVDVYESDSCASRGVLQAWLDPRIAQVDGSYAGFTWAAPPSTALQRVLINRAAESGTWASADTPVALLYSDRNFLEIVGNGARSGSMSAAPGAALELPLGGAASFAFGVQCSSGGPCRPQDPKARMTVLRAQFDLVDNVSPVPLSVSGSLLQPGAQRGTSQIAFNASDRGAGLYRATLLVDGQVRASRVVDENGGACRDQFAGNASPYDFTAPVPCKLVASSTLAVDTRTFPGGDGPHQVQVLVEDAAGNAGNVWGPNTVVVDNVPGGAGAGGPVAGVLAPRPAQARVALAGTRRGVIAVRFGAPVVIRGRLVDAAGRGVGRARVGVQVRRALAGAGFRPAGAAVTAADGSFIYRLGRGMSRDVRFAYRPSPSAAAIEGRVSVVVAAGVAMRTSAARVRNRHAVVFTGRAIGAPVPRRGLVVDLQVRQNGWQTFGYARTDRAGRFRFRYRFMRTFRTTTYVFRAQVRRQAAYPYGVGHSPNRAVKVLGR